MSEQNTATVAAEQVQGTLQEQAIDAAIVQEQAKDQRLQEQIVAAVDREAEADAEAERQAKHTLAECKKAFRKGEKAYRAGLLESGKLADLYLRQKMALGQDRAAAVQKVEGDLAEYSTTKVVANDLIGAYHACRLLAEEPGVEAADVPYGHYREAWSQLTLRQDEKTPQEHWVLLPGVEAECLAAFAKATTAQWSRARCLEEVKTLQRKYMAVRAKAAEEAKGVADARAKAQADVTEAKRIATLRAVQEAQQADARAAAAQGEDKALLTAAAEEARQKLEREQREFTESLAKADAEKRAAARADADAKAKRDAEAKAAEKVRKAQEKAALKAAGVKPDTKGVTGPLQPVGEAVTPEQAAEFCVEVIDGHDEPDTVLDRLLVRLAKSGELCAESKRAIAAALVILHREAKPSATAAA